MIAQKPEKKIRANKITLTREQIHFYDDNGFLVIPGIFKDEDCETMNIA